MAVSEPTAQPPTTNPFRRTRNPGIAPRVDWDTWYDKFKNTWKQDEHVSIIGPTGTGKSALSLELLKIRTWKIYVMTKPEDDKLQRALLRQNYVQVGAFPASPPDDIPKYLFWPQASKSMGQEARDQEKAVMRDMFQKVFEGPKGGRPGRWCICLDEARYVADPTMLGLMREIKLLLIQGRSLRISMVLSFQRPAWVPPEGYDQASYLFLAGDNDKRNVQRFREIGGADGDRVAATVLGLKKYEWAFVDARPGEGTIEVIKMPKGL